MFAQEQSPAVKKVLKQIVGWTRSPQMTRDMAPFLDRWRSRVWDRLANATATRLWLATRFGEYAADTDTLLVDGVVLLDLDVADQGRTEWELPTTLRFRVSLDAPDRIELTGVTVDATDLKRRLMPASEHAAECA